MLLCTTTFPTYVDSIVQRLKVLTTLQKEKEKRNNEVLNKVVEMPTVAHPND